MVYIELENHRETILSHWELFCEISPNPICNRIIAHP